MKIRGIISNDLDLDKCYPGYDPEQHLRESNRRSNTLDNANAGGTIICKPYNLKSI